MKKCTKCGIEKPFSEFHKNKNRKDGHTSACRACRNQKQALYRQQNKDKNAEYASRYRQQNKDKFAEYASRYRQKNKDKISERRARYRQENKDKIAEYLSRYRQQNKEKIAEQNARYYEQNKEKEPACVYKITNRQNGKIYIGETLRGELRWKDHLAQLRGGYHNNSKLQEDFDEFGEEVFEWGILKELPKDKEALLLEEARTISRLLKEDKDLYNLALTNEQLKLLQENGE